MGMIMIYAMLIELLIIEIASPSTQIVQDALENQILGPGFTVVNEHCGLLIKVDIPTHRRYPCFYVHS